MAGREEILNPSRVCRDYYHDGRCDKGENCAFAHTYRVSNQLCKHYQKGSCEFGNKCVFLHKDPINKKKKKTKKNFNYTRLCRSFVIDGYCKNNDDCTYIHNREPPNGACKDFYINGYCSRGTVCVFKHYSPIKEDDPRFSNQNFVHEDTNYDPYYGKNSIESNQFYEQHDQFYEENDRHQKRQKNDFYEKNEEDSVEENKKPKLTEIETIIKNYFNQTSTVNVNFGEIIRLDQMIIDTIGDNPTKLYNFLQWRSELVTVQNYATCFPHMSLANILNSYHAHLLLCYQSLSIEIFEKKI